MRPDAMPCPRRMRTISGAARVAKSPKPASWMWARSVEYRALPYRTRRVRSDRDARSHVALLVADSGRHRLRALRLRQETIALAAARRGPRLHGLALFHADDFLDDRGRRRHRRRALDGRPRRLVTPARDRDIAAAG